MVKKKKPLVVLQCKVKNDFNPMENKETFIEIDLDLIDVKVNEDEKELIQLNVFPDLKSQIMCPDATSKIN